MVCTPSRGYGSAHGDRKSGAAADSEVAACGSMLPSEEVLLVRRHYQAQTPALQTPHRWSQAPFT